MCIFLACGVDITYVSHADNVCKAEVTLCVYMYSVIEALLGNEYEALSGCLASGWSSNQHSTCHFTTLYVISIQTIMLSVLVSKFYFIKALFPCHACMVTEIYLHLFMQEATKSSLWTLEATYVDNMSKMYISMLGPYL